MEGFLIFLLVIIAIVIDFIIAAEFTKIAEEKGYYESKFFWYTLLFGILGILIVIALPDRGRSYISAAGSQSKSMIPDEKCAYSLSSLAKERKKSEESSSGLWYCQHCGTVNNLTSSYCKDCGKYK